MSLSISRRKLLAAASASPFMASLVRAADENPRPREGRIKQTVMPQPLGSSGLSYEERCELLAYVGFSGVDLPSLAQIPILQDYGLAPSLMTGTGTSFQDGFVRREIHDKIYDETMKGIDMCAEVGCPNLIGMPGERRGMSREEGEEHAIAILSRVAPYAEEKGVNVCMEITNSKVEKDNRTDQMFDKLQWGWNVCKATGSSRIKVVYDFYHVQISDGDVVRNMRDNLQYICHMHVAGVPTRGEIDRNDQELNFRFIAQAIADSGYDGFVAHEWYPTPGRNPILSLGTCFDVMRV
jgi:hydroxypyruvate isomerase